MEYRKVLNGQLTGEVKILPDEFNPVIVDHPTKGTWLPVVDEPFPDYDPETQKLGPVQYRIKAGDITRFREVINLTPDEIAERVRMKLEDADGKMARVVEDLVDALVAKGVITLSDLPQEAQDKIAERNALREKL